MAKVIVPFRVLVDVTVDTETKAVEAVRVVPETVTIAKDWPMLDADSGEGDPLVPARRAHHRRRRVAGLGAGADMAHKYMTEEGMTVVDMTREDIRPEDLADEEQSHVAWVQHLIDTGLAWRLEGAIGREAMALIDAGACMLGETGHWDYWGNYVPSRWGNYVPSRHEVEPGTKGSQAYCEARNYGRD